MDALFVDEFWYFMVELERLSREQKKSETNSDWLHDPNYQKK